MELDFFNNTNILESTQQFFSSVLDIKIAPAAKSEINIFEFLKEQLTDVKLLGKVKDARFVGMINNLSLEAKTIIEDSKLPDSEPSDDYDRLLVFGMEMNESYIPTKTDISRLTRALNRRSFSRPVVLIFKYGRQISFSSAERGQYKKPGHQGEKIGRISILRDIDTHHIHAGHERILLQLRINPLKVSTFRELYTQWQEVFNLKTLNNDFYKKIADWYFWATKVVKFPIDHYKLKNGNNKSEEELQTEANQVALIRFLTRIIFVWFLKSKSNRIVPEEIFDADSLRKHLKFNDEFESNYYKAILQNLFFASFNTKIDSEQRTFSSQKRTTFLENRFRYASLFINPDESAKELFANIPFLNGGLFSNLDYKESNKPTVRVDWFSDPEPDKKFRKNELYFPDYLFFDYEHEEDLSDFYESRSKQRVKGLLLILKEYYFTIEENTPLEQEIALDPELLGKIFENLLASYNPETRTTARKLTGSFYTPREIVNYMVNESLIAFLKTKLTEKTKGYQQLGNKQSNMFGNEGKIGQLDMQIDLADGKWDKKEDELEDKLRKLFAYESEENPFNGDTETTDAIIIHLSECKILDPACGSGAFPMGVLHQIVHALKKLDQDNEQWKKVQYERLIAPEVSKITNDFSVVKGLSSEEARKIAENQLHHELEELLENFARHDHNYTRKLHLIQECIYGVDIQPIAIHISKLRFFISLLVDQNIDFSMREKNYLLNSLPNLETKFVAANTLIPLNPGGQLKTREAEIVEIENKIKSERKKYFDCKSREEKIKIEKADEALRIEFAAKLKELTEQGRNNLKIQIQKIEDDIELRQKYKAKAQSDKDKVRISKGIEQLRKDLEKLIAQLAQFASGDEVAEKILNFNPYDANTSAPFFDPEIMFALQPDALGGFFNIVIGNPPYISYYSNTGSSLSESEKNNFLNTYDSVLKPNDRINSMNLMTERGLMILKPNGHLSFITNKTIAVLPSYIEVRRFLLSNSIFKYFVTDLDPFEAIVDCVVFGLNKTKNEKCKSKWYKGGIEEFELKDTSQFLANPRLEFHYSSHQNILSKIDTAKYKLENLIEVNRGVNIGGCFNEFLSPRKISKSYRKYLAGTRNISRYNFIWYQDDGYMFFDLKREQELRNKGATLVLGNHERYNQERLFIPESGQYLMAAYCNEDYYSAYGIMVGTNTNSSYSIKYACALLNSKLLTFYAIEKEILRKGKKATPHVGVKGLNSIPIHFCSKGIEKIITTLVDKILILKNGNHTTSTKDIEHKLDLIIYKLYALTYDECKIVDTEIEKLISLEDYTKMSIEELAKYDLKVT